MVYRSFPLKSTDKSFPHRYNPNKLEHAYWQTLKFRIKNSEPRYASANKDFSKPDEEHFTLNHDPAQEPLDAPIYEVRFKGHLDPSWAEWFGDLAMISTDAGETILRGRMVDQAALHGVLLKIQKLGLSLISVVPVGE